LVVELGYYVGSGPQTLVVAKLLLVADQNCIVPWELKLNNHKYVFKRTVITNA
jgi:hypothetical protein